MFGGTMLKTALDAYDDLGIDTKSYVVNIFDFDGTLYGSPTPNKHRLGNKLFGKLMSTIDQKGLGWFQNLITLDAKYTTDLGDHFIHQVVDAVRRSMADPNSKTILLTGRTTAYTSRVMAILDTLEDDLVFDEYILKPTPSSTYKESTGAFKKRVIDELVTRYNATEVNMWEDRIKHVREFSRHLDEHEQVASWNIHMIDGPDVVLSDDLEDEVISQLKLSDGLCKSAKNIDLPKPLYYGVILDSGHRMDILFNLDEWIPKGWKIIAHHMTIIFGDKDRIPEISDFLNENINTKVTLTATHVGISDDAIALKVDPGSVPCANKIPHITVAIPAGGKAVNSNYIETWNELDRPLTLSGTITAIYP